MLLNTSASNFSYFVNLYRLYPLATAAGKMCKYGKHWISAVKAGT